MANSFSVCNSCDLGLSDEQHSPWRNELPARLNHHGRLAGQEIAIRAMFSIVERHFFADFANLLQSRVHHHPFECGTSLRFGTILPGENQFAAQVALEVDVPVLSWRCQSWALGSVGRNLGLGSLRFCQLNGERLEIGLLTIEFFTSAFQVRHLVRHECIDEMSQFSRPFVELLALSPDLLKIRIVNVKHRLVRGLFVRVGAAIKELLPILRRTVRQQLFDSGSGNRYERHFRCGFSLAFFDFANTEQAEARIETLLLPLCLGSGLRSARQESFACPTG